MSAYIIGTGQAAYTRKPGAGTTTPRILAQATQAALSDAGLTIADIDGFGVASFTLKPDHAIDLAWKLGISANWLMEDTNGGASAGTMLQHAVHAVEAGEARNILLVAGDHMPPEAFANLVEHYNLATYQHLAPLPMNGPNPSFAMLTQRQMERLDLVAEDYGNIAIAQRKWASLNPGAVYRSELTMEEYLTAPLVSDPLRRYDCVPPVSGGDAIIVAAQPDGKPAAKVLTNKASYNFDHQAGDGITTGVSAIASTAWNAAGIGPEDVDVVSVYDDYPAMVVSQLRDLGLIPPHETTSKFISDRIITHKLPVNTSGGQLSAGQAGASGGMHGMVETARQLMCRAGDRQVAARFGVVTGYGMVLYRYGACATVSILEGA